MEKELEIMQETFFGAVGYNKQGFDMPCKALLKCLRDQIDSYIDKK